MVNAGFCNEESLLSHTEDIFHRTAFNYVRVLKMVALRRADIGFMMPRVEANSRVDVNQLGISSLQEVKFNARWLTSIIKTVSFGESWL